MDTRFTLYYKIKNDKELDELIDSIQNGNVYKTDNWEVIATYWQKYEESDEVIYIEIGIPTLKGITNTEITADCILFDAYVVNEIGEMNCDSYIDCEWHDRKEVTMDVIQEMLDAYAEQLAGHKKNSEVKESTRSNYEKYAEQKQAELLEETCNLKNCIEQLKDSRKIYSKEVVDAQINFVAEIFGRTSQEIERAVNGEKYWCP